MTTNKRQTNETPANDIWCAYDILRRQDSGGVTQPGKD